MKLGSLFDGIGGNCTHYPEYVCGKDFMADGVCEGCLFWAIRFGKLKLQDSVELGQ